MVHLRSDNLPAEVTSFVNRARERVQVAALLERSRLVTLTGVGGVGKTRLAIKVAEEIKSAYPDGVWLAELSPVADSALLAHAISTAAGLADQSARDQLDVLAEFLAGKRMLLLLDTCEHHLEACAVIAQRLLGAAPDLRILATSRAPLHVSAETVYTVEPLPASSPEIASNDAATLFMDRARAVTAEDLGPWVVPLCRRLDGIPLAIELAAVRLRGLGVERLAKELDDRFDILVGATRSSVPRHQTLRTAIGWSHELCEPQERLLWARLSVFAGSFDLEAVEAVCGDDRLVPGRVLPGLVEKSIVVPSGRRYGMLDTVREYGAEWLRALGETDLLRRRHRDHYLHELGAFEAEWFGPGQEAWLNRLDADFDNVRLALDVEMDPEVALEMAARLKFFGIGRRTKEVRNHMERALTRHRVPGPARARALYGCAWMAIVQGELEAADGHLAESLAIASEAQDVAWVTGVRTGLEIMRNDLDKVVRLAHDGADSLAGIHDPGIGRPYFRLNEGVAHLGAGRLDRARAVLEEVYAECVDRGELWLRGYAGLFLGNIALASGNVAEARRCAGEAVLAKRSLGDILGAAVCIDVVAQAASAGGEAERAARLNGICDAFYSTFGVPQFGAPLFSDARKVCERACRDRIGDDGYDRAYEEGQALDPDEGVTYALAQTPGR